MRRSRRGHCLPPHQPRRQRAEIASGGDEYSTQAGGVVPSAESSTGTCTGGLTGGLSGGRDGVGSAGGDSGDESQEGTKGSATHCEGNGAGPCGPCIGLLLRGGSKQAHGGLVLASGMAERGADGGRDLGGEGSGSGQQFAAYGGPGSGVYSCEGAGVGAQGCTPKASSVVML